MRPSMFAILVMTVTTAYIAIPTDAQATFSLIPETEQMICQGNTLSFSCKSDATSILLYAPGIINESQALGVFSSANVQSCTAIRNIAVTCILFDDGDSTTFTVTLTMQVPNNQPFGGYQLFCHPSNAVTPKTTTFRVYGPVDSTSCPSKALDLLSCDCISESNCIVNLEWSPCENVAQYNVSINGIPSILSIQNEILLNLTQDNYTVIIHYINSCGIYPHIEYYLLVDDSGCALTDLSISTTSTTPGNLSTVTLEPTTTCGLDCMASIGVLGVATFCSLAALTVVFVYLVYIRGKYKKELRSRVQNDQELKKVAD